MRHLPTLALRSRSRLPPNTGSGLMMSVPGWCSPRLTALSGRVPTFAQLGEATSIAYGQLPYTLFETIRHSFVAAVRARRAGVVPRSQ
jgi:hypothetical protein